MVWLNLFKFGIIPQGISLPLYIFSFDSFSCKRLVYSILYWSFKFFNSSKLDSSSIVFWIRYIISFFQNSKYSLWEKFKFDILFLISIISFLTAFIFSSISLPFLISLIFILISCNICKYLFIFSCGQLK